MDHKTMRNKNSHGFIDMYDTMPIEVSYFAYKAILQEMCKVILKHILDGSDGFKMPSNLGYIQIGKYRPKSYTEKSLSVDYKSSKELNKRIYHLNEHSDGYKFRLYWSKSHQYFPDMYKYQLSLVRANKRRLAQLIFKHTDYLNINDIQFYKM